MQGESVIRTRVKICGITRPEDALMAARLGADAIGLVFYAPSPRAVTLERAQEVLAALPAFVTSVGLFVNETYESIQNVLQSIPLDLLQFHGDESPKFCEQFSRPYIKALRMRDGVDVLSAARQYRTAKALLLDAYTPAARGGTGETFDWNLVPRNAGIPIILAGGLEPGNVVKAVQRVRPYAVDLSSGVEAAKGVKDKDKLAALMTAVNSLTG